MGTNVRLFQAARTAAAGAALAVLTSALPACDAPLAPSGLEWTISPPNADLRPGSAATFSILIQTKANINAAVDLTVEALPAGLTPSFTSMRLPDTAATATLTIQAGPGIQAGIYTVRVTAAEVGGSQSTEEVRVTVTTSDAPDFALDVSPIEAFMPPGAGAQTFTYFVRPLNGFSGVVSASLSVPPEILVAQPLSPASVTISGGGAGGTFVLGRGPVADRPVVEVMVTARSGALVKTRRILIRLNSA